MLFKRPLYKNRNTYLPEVVLFGRKGVNYHNVKVQKKIKQLVDASGVNPCKIVDDNDINYGSEEEISQVVQSKVKQLRVGGF